jgi:hypothetical protein
VTGATGHVPLGMQLVPHHGGTAADEVAVVSRSAVDGTVMTRVYDLGSGAVLRNVFFFGGGAEPAALGVLAGTGGSSAPELAVLGRHEGTGELRIQVKDAASRELLVTLFPER